MFFRILKRDLKRKKTMNIILLLFIVLASMFVASGINNVLTVANGTDYFLDKAGIGDVMLIIGKGEGMTVEEALGNEPAITDYRIEDLLFGDYTAVRLNGKKPEGQNRSVLLQSIDNTKIKFFDTKNEEIASVPEGKVYISGKLIYSNPLEIGDTIELTLGDVKKTLTFAGQAKDAFLGSNFMGNSRFLMNDKDMADFLADESTENMKGQICYADTNDVPAATKAAGKVAGVMFSGARSVIKLTYVMDLLVALLVLLLSVCLMIVAFVVLKFTINFTIAEEFREIGVMKAIGLRNFKIRSLYITKYLMMSIVGSIIGFFISIPFGKKLLEASSKTMMLGNDLGILPNFIGGIAVIVIIILLAYLSTSKIKKLTPIDAVRVGQTGERYKKKTPYRIGKSHLGTSLYLAVNDVLSSVRRYLTIMISFLICTLFVLVLVNTTTTMKSPKLATLFGPVSDLYYTDNSIAQLMTGGSKEDAEKYLKDRVKEFTDDGMPCELSIEIHYKYNLTFDGNEQSATFVQTLATTPTEIPYIEGSAPQNKNEIAITPQIADTLGLKIGDTVTIDFGEEKLDCMVTAYYQTMQQVGQLIRLHADAPTDFSHVASMQFYQVYFTDQPTDDEIADRKDRISKLVDTEKRNIRNTAEYCADCVEVADTMEAVQFLLLGITLIVVLLVTILMERSFIADEKTQIAILKAIGFKDSSVILWHIARFGLVTLFSVLLAAALSIPVTNLCITPIFKMMGAISIDYKFSPFRIFVLYPGIVFAATVVVAWITSLYTKTIKSSDTANIE